MADLRNGETMVDVSRNETKMGDSGRKARFSDSCFLLAGGTSDTYVVTINYNRGHFCKVEGGGDCKGNLFGKKKNFGAINVRDTSNPEEWCKHVKAVLANPEQIAEAQEISAIAFGAPPQPIVDTSPLIAEPVKVEPVTVPRSAQDRLAELEAERDSILDEIAAESAAELRTVVVELLGKFDYDTIKQALRDAA